MQVIPAIDLLGGKAVRLHQGRYDQVTVYDEDPAGRAKTFAAVAPALHVVDLEGAREGRPVQRETARAIVAAFGAAHGDARARESDPATRLRGVQIGGGIRDAAAAEAYLSLGAARIVLGTSAVKDRPLVVALAENHPGRVVLAIDAKDGLVALDGWTEVSRTRAVDLAAEVRHLALGAVLYTDIARDGTGVGPNVEATAEMARALSGIPVIASGGIGSLDHLRALAAAGISAAVVGRAIYDAKFTLEEAFAAAR